MKQIKKKILFGEYVSGVGLKKALSKKPDEVVEEVKKSGLRGRGGAGFPTGLKWEFALKEKGDEKYVICNADEGEPGTFKDRKLLMEQPEKVIEGLTIAGYAIGAKQGYIYLRGEYIYILPTLEKTIEQLKKENLLGKNILDSGFDFDIEIRLGAGAYVCGEEFALIESMNGYRGEPRNKPPFPTQKGFRDKPTVVNNVETLCFIPYILSKGAEWFKSFGTEGSTGTKLFSISGDIEHPGVYELELGVTLNEVLELVGARNPKAVQVGGASGICVAKKDFDKPISFQGLPPGGSIIVFGENRDMLKVLKNFLEFFVEESCGQCTPCREGNYRLLEGVEMLEKGECSVRYVRELLTLCDVMKTSSKCGLGQTSPNCFLSILENFKDEIIYR
ncbi:[Fe] hydrogenase NAD-binding subunit [Thermotomaculum hydrothermale]|uniref:[Fe] hydrogenase NAD-binding subunit n=1 Tax=Thermotomaculum hydrothermale TaxID=981385 RepID=A0A7R6PYN7_9BACT|nr:NADH-ubiquinone oxidoreductase-F iron-sulfur binding region domain-containing protein [Thermotomaculum hydrothermale]BBB32053.1 [Fe] hydrogenase NAD-binding subunit [Thermotomaculum hydrothermale]